MGIIDANSAYHNPAKLHAIATRKNEIAMEGPAGGRPCISAPAVLPVRRKFAIRSSACACRMEGAWKYSPAAAVPVSTKIPEPIIAPMPSAVSDHGPSVLLSRVSGCSEPEISLSMDLQQNACLSEVRITSAAGSVDDCDKSSLSPHSGSRAWALPRPGTATAQASGLPFRLTACQLLHLALLRSARVIARLLRLFRLHLLAGGALGFFA